MSTPSSNDNGRARRLIVTLLIASAAAAVTAGVALQQHPHAKRSPGCRGQPGSPAHRRQRRAGGDAPRAMARSLEAAGTALGVGTDVDP